jgi:hypothetical protein
MTDHSSLLYAHLAWEYFGLVFIAGLGILQVAAAYGGFRGLLIAPGEVRVRFWPGGHSFALSRVAFGYVFAALTVIPCLVDFFGWNGRNATGVIQGSEQAGLFVVAMAAAVLFTLLFASLVNQWRLQGNQTRGEGLEALKDITWVQAVWRGFLRLRRGLG